MKSRKESHFSGIPAGNDSPDSIETVHPKGDKVEVEEHPMTILA